MGSASLSTKGFHAWRVVLPEGSDADLRIAITFPGSEQSQTAAIFSILANTTSQVLSSNAFAIVGNGIDHQNEYHAISAMGHEITYQSAPNNSTRAIPIGLGATLLIQSSNEDRTLTFGAFGNSALEITYELVSEDNLEEPVSWSGGASQVSIETTRDSSAVISAQTFAGSEGVLQTWSHVSQGPALVLAVPSYTHTPVNVHTGLAVFPNEILIRDSQGVEHCSCSEPTMFNSVVVQGVGSPISIGPQASYVDAVSVASWEGGDWLVKGDLLLDPRANPYRIWFVDLGM